MATITKLKSGKFYCQIRRTGFKPIYRTFETRADAVAWAHDRELAIKYQTPLKELDDETLLDIGMHYCATVLEGKSSQYETTMRVKRMSAHFPQPFSQITKFDVNAYRIERLKTVSPTTCRDELILLSRFFKWVRREYLFEIPNPCDDVTFPRALKPRDKVVTREELQMLLSAMTPRMAVVIELAYETAMRRSEILRLTPNDINLEDRILDVVNGKTGSRSVPLTRRACELLGEAIKGCPSPTARMFRMAATSVTQALRRARKECGLSDDIRVHQLRHSRITEVAKKGFNQAQIMMVSGHRDVRSVQRYTHLNVRDVLELLD